MPRPTPEKSDPPKKKMKVISDMPEKARCNSKILTRWRNKPKHFTPEECAQMCLDKPSCKFAAWNSKIKICNEYEECNPANPKTQKIKWINYKKCDDDDEYDGGDGDGDGDGDGGDGDGDGGDGDGDGDGDGGGYYGMLVQTASESGRAESAAASLAQIDQDS